MAPKKSASAGGSQARKSDLSTARFVPVDGAQALEPAATQPAAAATAPAAGADESMAEAQSRDQAGDKKDGAKKEEKEAVAIEDLNLPKSIITRLAKGVLPPNTQIQANAILAMSKSATVFINYLASHANEHTFNANKKTIAPADVFKALDDIEFGFLKEPLEAEFAKFSAMQVEKRNTYRKKPGSAKPEDADMADASTASATAPEAPAGGAAIHKSKDAADGDDGPARATKKQRVGGTTAVAAASGGAAGAVAARGGSETEDEIDAAVDEEQDEEEEEDDDVEEEDEEEEAEDSGDETQDAMEDGPRREDGDEALDGDDSD